MRRKKRALAVSVNRNMESILISLEYIPVIKDISYIFAAIATGCVAIKGLQSWSRELKGKADFDVARSLIRSTYKLRDELRCCRSPFIRLDEFPEDYDRNKMTSKIEAEIEADAYSFIYSNRWKPVETALQDFESQALEAEALWGTEFKSKTDALCHCAQDLWVALEADINNKASNGKNFECDPGYGKEIRSKIRATRYDKDCLTSNIDNAINKIETEIRPHFKRS